MGDLLSKLQHVADPLEGSRRVDKKAIKMLYTQTTSKTLCSLSIPKEPRSEQEPSLECGTVPQVVGDGRLSTSVSSHGYRMVRKAKTEISSSRSKRLKVRRNRRGTLKRMPGGVGGTAAKAAYPSRLVLDVPPQL